MDIFSIFFNMKVCCVFSLESPHQGDCNEYTQHTIINIKGLHCPLNVRFYQNKVMVQVNGIVGLK